MFTGIIEALGEIEEISTSGTNTTFWVGSPLSSALKVDQSVAHDGVCLTVEAIRGNLHQVTAIAETLEKTNLGTFQKGQVVNLERSLLLSSRLDGHFVQGHVDTTGNCTQKTDKEGSFEFTIEFPRSFSALVIEKGSVSVNGISLTAWNVQENAFTIAVIPYTMEHTNLKHLEAGELVNIEFDMIGKYLVRNLSLKK